MAETPKTEAIDRAVALLLALADADLEGLSLGELASTTGINKSTAYRALSTLRQHDFSAQSPETGHYRLGAVALSLGDKATSPARLAESLHPALVALSHEMGELVHLGVWAGDRVQYIDKVEPARAIRVWSTVGALVPVATSSLGRALLAARGTPDEQLRPYLLSSTGRSAVTHEHLVDVVHEARIRGYAVEIEENEPGIACLGMAVLKAGRPVCAISVTALAARVTVAALPELAEAMRRTVVPLLPPGLSLSQPAGDVPAGG